ncbi:MAG TPA: ABC transporter substrate-binding protein [Mycobacteriales bacterium]|nr:ABC transporter substrate-binding protein [Mycobacteriales bacterium]
MNIRPESRTLLRGYGPLACLLVAFALMAAFVPTDAPQRITVTKTGAATSAGGGVASGPAGSQGGRTGAAGGTTGASAPGSGPAGSSTAATGPSAVPAHTKRCSGPQVSGDPYSPPCISFHGSNGGVTARGVTGSTITVAFRQTSDPGFQQTLAKIGGAQFSDTPADIRRTIEGLADYFNKNFQFYGRKLHFVFYNGQGSQTNELLGGGQQEAGADALKVATSIKAFADMSATTEPYGDALSREHVLNFGEPYLSQKWFEQRAPYAWSLATDCTAVSVATAQAGVVQLAGKPAQFAGPGLQGKPRKLAILAPDNPWYQECVQNALSIYRRAHVAVPETIPYQLNLSTLSSQAASVIAKLKSQGITTVVCGCDPVFPVYLTQRAQEQNYNPEWAVVGVALTDQDIVGQLFNQNEWAHAFGVTYQGPTIPYQATLGYAAYKSVRSDEPAQAVNLIYAQMYMLALGIQLAGPDLTAANFEKGMRAYPGGTGEFGTWGFPNGHFTPTLDGAEIYWDPNATSKYNGKQGAYIISSPRYLTGHVPRGNFPHTPYKGHH